MSIRSRGGIDSQSRGFSILGWVLTIPAIAVVLLILAVGLFEGRKLYWDNKVKELCGKDGGVRIFEQIRISKADTKLLAHNDGKIAVPVKELASLNAPVYSESTTVRLREWNPEVRRTEATVVRRADQKIIARWVYYSRNGGDFPSGIGHQTSLGCPELKKITTDLEHLFIAEGDSK